ncbi:MAG TPA: PepSY domain-containing protein [Gammaproteobacteria bacterium]
MAATRSRSRRPRRALSSSHRWLGILSIVFVVLLSTTGIALNHTEDLNLDSRFIGSAWLLDWYGIEAPEPGASFRLPGGRITEMGARLYLNGRDVGEAGDTLVGAVATPSYIVAATGSELVLLLANGDLVERIDTTLLLPAAISAIGMLDESLVLESGDGLYGADENLLSFEPATKAAAVPWSAASPLSSAELAELQRLYRGRGVSLERLLLDLHSGKIFAAAGPILLDIVGVSLILLSFLGAAMWFRRPGR